MAQEAKTDDTENDDGYEQFRRRLERLKRSGVVHYGPADDQCIVLEVTFQRYTVEGETDSWFPYEMVWFGDGRVRTPGMGISHLCGKDNCIVLRHYRLEPNDLNSGRIHCHKAFRKWVNKWKFDHQGGSLQGTKLTVRMCKINCTHRPNCFWNC